MKRPILVATIGYILGIIVGLYFSFSIVLFYIPVFATYFLWQMIKNNKEKEKKKFHLLSFYRYFRYIKLFLSKKSFILIIILSIFSNMSLLIQKYNYNIVYAYQGEIQMIGIILDAGEEKQYNRMYEMKIIQAKALGNWKGKKIFLSCSKNETLLEYGDRVLIKGEYEAPEVQRNDRGFNQTSYYQQMNRVGTIKVKEKLLLEKNQNNFLFTKLFYLKEEIKTKIDTQFSGEMSSLVKGLLLGDTKEIEKQTKESFQNANISHILAISGLHISSLIVLIQIMTERTLGKRMSRIITIIILIFYLCLIGFSPSIMRAALSGILILLSKLLYKPKDVWNLLSLSLLVILFYNPFLIRNIGLQLSYGGTLGILIFQKKITNFMKEKQEKRDREKKKRLNHIIKIRFLEKHYKILKQKIVETLMVTLSAQVILFPLMCYHFHFFSVYFLITNLLISFLMVPIMYFVFFYLFSMILPYSFHFSIFQILYFLIQVLLLVSQIGKLPFCKIYLPTPHFLFLLSYYVLLFICWFIFCCYYSKKQNQTKRRARNLISLFYYYFSQKKNKIIAKIKFFLISTLLLIGIVYFIPKDLKVYFVDVGQGDCTFIETPRHKKILIDGGGSLSDYDIGKNVLLPYILNRGCTTIDTIYVSHFDQDHVGGLLTIMKELKVKNIIIGKQFETCENYERFKEIVKEKKIKVHIVEAGQRIKIEKNLYFDILWPSSNNVINENILNNNSLVCKLVYYNFSMLFTGDIEEFAEKAILEKYKNLNKLQSTILKVAHHGSKSSSIEEFLKAVKPKIALIGVGEKNTFGHPNSGVLERIERIWK